jgi:MFS family permease
MSVLTATVDVAPRTSVGKKRTMASVVFAGSIGTVIEWYDFLIYGTAAALVFNSLFFPNVDPLTGTLAALGAYAAGFFARPVGGILFGHFGDRIGRKTMLMITMLVMGLGTFCVGLLPTYHQIGIWRRSCWLRCASCRASALAANGAALRWSCWSTRRPAGAAFTAAWCRSASRSAC